MTNWNADLAEVKCFESILFCWFEFNIVEFERIKECVVVENKLFVSCCCLLINSLSSIWFGDKSIKEFGIISLFPSSSLSSSSSLVRAVGENESVLKFTV